MFNIQYVQMHYSKSLKLPLKMILAEIEAHHILFVDSSFSHSIDLNSSANLIPTTSMANSSRM